MDKLLAFEQPYRSGMLPDVRPGDTVRVWQKIKEDNKERLQPFEGLVIARKHGKGPSATITVRKISFGVGVERIFPLHSPIIDRIEVLKRTKTRRAKLYYVRKQIGKKVRKKKVLELPATGAAEQITEETKGTESPGALETEKAGT